jgi:hypothetical protein
MHRNVRYRRRLVDDVLDRLKRIATNEPMADETTDVVTCLACIHFDEPNAACRAHPGYATGSREACPPPRTIAFGCAGFTDIDQVPF